MSSFNRRTVLLSLTAASGLTLAGCGFEPVYGSGGSASRFLNQITVDAPTDNRSYLLTRELEDRLGRNLNGGYGLSISLSTFEDSAGRTITGATSRYNMIGEATFALRDLATGEVLTSGKTKNYVGYSATGSTVATVASREDATERLMVILTDQIVANLLAYAAQNAQ
ncbi:LPS assembly lipoprotein LptE [Shimia sp. FJ5]|uniref:LPS assembly lipoprotein LptE n=1 Tax=Shimia sp. FJ5 TaxID=3079054 RepID=UPI0026292D95|nr:LPS assembly lipoprotein LptE [Shimia sp. FJ5]MDV4144828.1 LPS assembly lipoprotein LptE [Shimia sp. FJ5]